MCLRRWILETYYNAQVCRMSIVCLHPENEPDPLVIEVPDMQNEVHEIMKEQRDLHLVRPPAHRVIGTT